METAQLYGEDHIFLWRRSYNIHPPALEKADDRDPGHDPRYAEVEKGDLPLTECLEDTIARFLPYWHESIAPAVKVGKKAIILAHGNSLRALVKYLYNVSDEEITSLNIPSGIPLIYELDKELRLIKHIYLGDSEAVARAAKAVADQGKVR